MLLMLKVAIFIERTGWLVETSFRDVRVYSVREDDILAPLDDRGTLQVDDYPTPDGHYYVGFALPRRQLRCVVVRQ